MGPDKNRCMIFMHFSRNCYNWILWNNTQKRYFIFLMVIAKRRAMQLVFRWISRKWQRPGDMLVTAKYFLRFYRWCLSQLTFSMTLNTPQNMLLIVLKEAHLLQIWHFTVRRKMNQGLIVQQHEFSSLIGGRRRSAALLAFSQKWCWVRSQHISAMKPNCGA